jgi:hypothetical protein
MKSVIAFWSVALATLGGLLFWRNKRKYARKSVPWLLGKSAVELLILGLTAAFSPALLIVWLVTWVTRPIETPWLRTVIGVLTGVTFGFLSNVAVEVLLILGVFSIDMKTGSHERSGFLNCWSRAKHEAQSEATVAA